MEALALDILNSDWHDYHGHGRDEDRLDKPGWLESLAQHWAILVPGPADKIIIEKLRALRQTMQHIVEACIQQHMVEQVELAQLNAYLAQAPMHWHIIREGQNYQVLQQSLSEGWSFLVGETALSFATLLAEHDPARIKRCENTDCQWVYYDESVNQTRRWCEETCANLMRVRRYRIRQRAQAQIGHS